MRNRRLILQNRGRSMMAAPTPGEHMLWQAIRGRRLGVVFRRQVPLADRFIVDFLAPVQKLVIEIDGLYHSRRTGTDARRDRKLTRLGYRVLRLPEGLVREQLAEAIALIRSALARPS